MSDKILFRKGIKANLPSNLTPGTIYVTTDEKSMYVDIDSSNRIRLGNVVYAKDIEELTKYVTAGTGAYDKEIIYFLESYGTYQNALLKYNGGNEFIHLNSTAKVDSLQTIVNTLTETTIPTLDGRVGTLETRQAKLLWNDDEGVKDFVRIVNIETDIAGIKEEIGTSADTAEEETIYGKIANLQGQISANDTEINNLVTKSNFEGTLGVEAGTKITGLDSQSTTVSGAITQLNTKAGNLQQDITNINTEIGENDSQDTTTLWGSINGINAEIGETESEDATTLWGAINAVEAVNNAQQTVINNLGNTYKTIASYNSEVGAVTGLTTEAKTVVGAINELKEDVGTNADDIQDLKDALGLGEGAGTGSISSRLTAVEEKNNAQDTLITSLSNDKLNKSEYTALVGTRGTGETATGTLTGHIEALYDENDAQDVVISGIDDRLKVIEALGLNADAMTYKGAVSQVTQLPTTDVKGGDTYIATGAFTFGEGGRQVYAGDLLVANADQKSTSYPTVHTTQTGAEGWVVVDTGYIEAHENKLVGTNSVVDSNNIVTTAGTIEMQSHLGGTLATITVAEGTNLRVTNSSNAGATIDMVWGTF